MLRRLRGLRSALAFAAVACSDGTGPADFTIEIVSGDQLQGVAGWQFPELVVRVLDQAGTPTPNVDVRFVVTAGGGGTSDVIIGRGSR